MATLVLGILGSLVNPIAGAAGAAIGAYIDKEYIFPPPDLEGPLAAGGGLKEMRGSEGMPFIFAIGEQVRVPAKVIWIGPEVMIQEAGQYFNHVGIDVCQAVDNVDFMLRLYANGQLVWADGALVEETDTMTMKAYLNPFTDDQQGWVSTLLYIYSATGGLNLTKFIVGSPVTVDGIPSPIAQIDGTEFIVYDVGFYTAGVVHGIHSLPTDGTFMNVRQNFIVNDPIPAGDLFFVDQTVTITQPEVPFSPGTLVDVVTYNGGVNQLAPTLMSTIEGIDKTPGRRGRCTAIIHKLNISKFGNQMPNFEAVVRPNPGMSLAQAIDSIMERTGNIIADDWDTSAVTGGFDGAAIEEPVDSLAILQIILLAYRVGTREVEGKLVFFLRSAPDQIAIAQEDLAAKSEGAEAEGFPFREEDIEDSRLPYRFEVQFADLDNKLEPAVAKDTGTHVLDGSKNIHRIRLPLTMTRQRGQCLAKILMLAAFAERQRRAMQLPPLYRQVAEGDEILTTVDGDLSVMHVKSLDYGRDGLITLQGTRAQPHIDDITDDDCPAEGHVVSNEGQVDVPAATALVLTDIAPLNDFEAENAGFHIGTPRFTDAAVFTNVFIHRSLGTGLPFVLVQSLFGELRGGFALIGSNDPGVTSAYIDEATTLTVVLFGAVQLNSITDEALISGSNMAFWGKEVMAFRTATFIADTTWELTGLLRGLRGTESEVQAHSATSQEEFTMIEPDAAQQTITQQFQEVPISSFGTQILLKPQPNGTDLADADQVVHNLKLGSLLPFPVYNVRGVRNSSSDLTMTWDRQTRRLHQLFAPVVDPLLEPSESYEVDVLKSGLVIATYAVTVSSFSYTASQQTGDGLPGSGSIDFQIYQISATIGRGKVKTITI